MWDFKVDQLDDHEVQKYELLHGSEPVLYSQVLILWKTDPSFREFFVALLTSSPYSAYRWETPALTKATQGQSFQFVLLDCPGLARRRDPNAVAEQFETAEGKDVLTFSNLGGDAVMVVPCPVGPASAYGHLASFVRQAPRQQVDHLWQQVGEQMQERLSDKPVWLSTAGMGVAWLHVRLDSRPKYYGYEPFRRWSGING
jgi:hypothetical protein